MTSTDRYDGSASAFEGEKTLLVRSVPAGALVKRATLTATPVPGPAGALFQERIDLTGAGGTPGRFGTTKIANGGTAAFVEVDFHARRTLAAVSGTNLNGTNVQVDLGGVYVEINHKGAILTPSDPTAFPVTDGTLPGLTVGKFKLTPATGGNAPDVSAVTIRSTPSNLTVRLGKTTTLWARPGELAAPDTSPDFAALLQAFLATAKVENGIALVPITVRWDGLARLSFALDLEYIESVAATPNGLTETLLPFDAGTVANAPVQLAVTLPPDARVVPGATTARVRGSFASTRIVPGYGAPTGEIIVAGTAVVTPQSTLAQILPVAAPVSATAIDLSLTAPARAVRLGLDLRADLDGKPDGTSLLGGTVAFTLPGNASPAPAWLTVPLPAEFHFGRTDRATRYWIVLQSFDGQAAWNAVALATPVAMQQTSDNGLSWRAAALSGASATAPPLCALYRLRYVPDRFEMPIEMQIGTGPAAQRVKLDRYRQLNRVDFALDLPELAAGFNDYLRGTVPASCSRAEHVANGDFRQWHKLGDDLGTPHVFNATPSTGIVFFSSDGQRAYASTNASSKQQLAVVDVMRDTLAGAPIQLQGSAAPLFGVTSADGQRLYVGTQTAIHVVDAANGVDLGAVTVSGIGAPLLGALSADGAFLYVATASGVHALATQSLENALGTNQPLSATSDAGPVNPSALAVSPDGTKVYAGASARLVILAAPSLDVLASLALGTQLAALAVTPDGKRVVALDAAAANSTTAWIVDAASGAVETSVSLASGTPLALTIAADGARAYVLTRDAAGTALVSALDLTRRAPAGSPVTLSTAPLSEMSSSANATVTLGTSGAGTRLYAADSVTQTLTSISLGQPTPADWTPSGTVQLTRLRGATPVVLVGDAAFSKTPRDASISQVVPVTGDCGYTFAFAADADVAGFDITGATATTRHSEPEAAAELIWLDGTCGVTRTDTVPIAKRHSDSLPAYTTPVRAPAGATQAEIRFNANAGTALALTSVSLAGSSDAVANGDLRALGADGSPSGWTVTPAGARAVIAANQAPDTGTRLRNPTSQVLELAQTVDVAANARMHVEFAGRSVTAGANPSIAVEFSASDGSPAGAATEIAIGAADFERHAGELVAPDGAVRARVRVSLPPAAALDVRTFAVRFVNQVHVPVSFIAQSPGELHVSDAVVAYERVPLPAPPVPASGLCAPTPAGQMPGDRSAADDTGHCACCDATRKMQRMAAVTTPAGRPAALGVCVSCGTPMLQIGGTLPQVQVGALAVRAELPVATIATTTALPSRPSPPITDVTGIGKARADRLATIGIRTLDQLAAANPKDIAQALPGVSAANAVVLVNNARELGAAAKQ